MQPLEIEDFKLNYETCKIEIEAGRANDVANETYYISISDFKDYVCDGIYNNTVTVSITPEETTQISFYEWYEDNGADVWEEVEKYLNKVEDAKAKNAARAKERKIVPLDELRKRIA